MPITYTTNVQIAKPANLMQGWGTIYNRNADLLDRSAPLGGFAAAAPPASGLTTPYVHIKGMQFRWVALFTGNQFGDDLLIYLKPYTTSHVTAIWNNIDTSDSYPTDQSFIPLAKITTDKTTAVVIIDERCPYLMTGFSYLIPLDYPDDTAAAAGGVQFGELYHTSGLVKIRTT